ncbi:MAG: hypothetical protein LVQ95_03885 [Candidatus Micrarchaeales archaeon]|nr:hypothetical protein [Candidatus Micrarchaeales archaeon]
MDKATMTIFAVLALLLIPSIASAGGMIGTASIRAPAVLVGNNTGSLTTITLSVFSGGNGTVRILGPSDVGLSTNQSAQIAARYASAYLNRNFSSYNFNYSMLNTSGSVNGPSGGAAMTMLAISALSGKPLPRNFTMTGTISPNGSIGPVGGVYDKTAAAKAAGLSFILVPAVPSDSIYDELYFLAQDLFKIPIVQVTNISDAYQFTFGLSSPSMHETNFTFAAPLNLSAVPNAEFKCSNNCNTAPFEALINATIAMSGSEISRIRQPTFSNAEKPLSASVSQLPALVQKGYLYPAGDIAFLDYLHAFYFNNYVTSTSQGLAKLQNISGFCGSINIPNLTSSNYEYVLTGEIRQQWADYTLNATISGYNSTVETSDDVLYAMRLAASAYAWCKASEMLYNASAGSGYAVVPSPRLSSIADARLARAAAYGNNMYYTAAQEAMSVDNYPLAILQADYAYAISNASDTNMTTAQLLNVSASISHNATFGLWATQFSNEEVLYASQAMAAANSSAALGDAQSAYTSALLARQFNTDMMLIAGNLTPGSAVQQIMPNSTSNTPLSATDMETAVIGLGIAIILFSIILYLLIKIVSRPEAKPKATARKAVLQPKKAGARKRGKR